MLKSPFEGLLSAVIGLGRAYKAHWQSFTLQNSSVSLPEAEAGFEEPDAEREGPGDSSKEYHFYFQKKLYLQCFGNKQMIG